MVAGKSIGKQLIEDVIVSLGRLLKGDSRFFKQIGLDVGAGYFSSWSKVNSDKFTLLLETTSLI